MMKQSVIVVTLMSFWIIVPAAYHPVADYRQQMLVMAMLYPARFEGPHNHEPRRERRGNMPRGTYTQQDRQLLAQQKKSNNKDRCHNSTHVHDRIQLPRKFNHVPCGNKPKNKVRYR